MHLHPPYITAQLIVWAFWALVALIVVERTVVKLRRGLITLWDVAGTLVAVVLVVAGWTLLGWLFKLGDAWYRSLPPQEQEIVQPRIAGAATTFFLAVFGLVAICGGYSVVAAFAVFDPKRWARARVPLPLIGPFTREYWAIVARADVLTMPQKQALWARHAGYGLVLLFLGVSGIVMVVGAIRDMMLDALMTPWLIALVIAAFASPTDSDRAMLQRLPTERPEAGVGKPASSTPHIRSRLAAWSRRKTEARHERELAGR